MPTPSQRPPQFGQPLLPDRALVPCPGPRAAVSASRRSPVRPVASGWLAGSLQHRRFLPKVRGRWGNAPPSPQWGRGGPARGGRGNPDRAPDPQIGGPGPRTKGRGPAGPAGSAGWGVAPSGGHCQRGGVGVQTLQGCVWLERNVIYGVTVARGQTHPWTSSRHKAFWAAWAFLHIPHAHVLWCVRLSTARLHMGYPAHTHTRPLLLAFRQHHKSRICVPALSSDSCRGTASVGCAICVSPARDTRPNPTLAVFLVSPPSGATSRDQTRGRATTADFCRPQGGSHTRPPVSFPPHPSPR